MHIFVTNSLLQLLTASKVCSYSTTSHQLAAAQEPYKGRCVRVVMRTMTRTMHLLVLE